MATVPVLACHLPHLPLSTSKRWARKSQSIDNAAQNPHEERDARKQAEKILQWDLISDQVQLVAEGQQVTLQQLQTQSQQLMQQQALLQQQRPYLFSVQAQPCTAYIWADLHRDSQRSKTCEITRMQPQLRAKV
jgi:hypothetical protein